MYKSAIVKVEFHLVSLSLFLEEQDCVRHSLIRLRLAYIEKSVPFCSIWATAALACARVSLCVVLYNQVFAHSMALLLWAFQASKILTGALDSRLYLPRHFATEKLRHPICSFPVRSCGDAQQSRSSFDAI